MTSPSSGPGSAVTPRAAGEAARALARRVRLRRRLMLGRARIKAAWWGVVQSAVGAAVAWELASRLLGHKVPFFASVAAMICLSTSYQNRLRRVIEMGLGVAVGVGLGDLLVRVIGHGSVQIGVTVLLAMSAALLLDGGALIVNQAGLQAVFVVALPPPQGGYVGRWEDALVGGAVALAIAFAAPADPRPQLRRDVDDVVHTVARALRAAAAAAREGDADAAYQALELARSTEGVLDSWRDSVHAGREITRLSPLRRSGAREVAVHEQAIEPIDHAVRNLRVALRRLVVVIEEGSLRSEPGEQALIDALEQLAGALFTLPGALRDPDGEGGRRAVVALTRLAGSLDPRTVDRHGLSASVVMAQLRSAVIDLFAVVGVDAQVVRELLP